MRLAGLASTLSMLTGRKLVSAEMRFKNMAEEARFLRKRVNEYIGNQAVRELALRIIFPACESRDEVDQALTIGEWVQENIRYVHEGRETFQSPQTTLRLGAGDCDDMTILILALCGCIGIRGKMVIMKINGRWAHIFPVVFVKVPGEGFHRLTLDATLSDPIRDLTNPIAKVQARGSHVHAIFA